MRFQCSHCRGILAIEECEPGEAVACGHCGSAVAVPESRVSAGAVIGDFVIREKLGAGGMGSVYLAHQVSLDRAAALKVLHSRYAADESYIRDFIHEARAAAALNHPNIVQAYAVGEDEGLFYFGMEYVSGSTLKQVLLHGGRMVPERVLDIGIQIASALDFGWQHQGLVHRDIKPDNIILTGEGAVKLADLGLARKMTETASDGTQELYGTPQYIAPEQLLGHHGDNRSDIYSLGATLYHTITGQFPYSGPDPAVIAQKHLSESLVPTREACADVPEAFATVIETMLAKRPPHRYQDTAELVRDLNRIREGAPPQRDLPPGAQDPIDLYSDEAVALADGVEPDPGARDRKGNSKTRVLSVSKAVTTSGARGAAADAAADTRVVGKKQPSAAEEPATVEYGASRRRRHWVLSAVAAVLLATLGGVGVFLFTSADRSPGEVPDSPGIAGAAGQAPAASAAQAALDDLRRIVAAGEREKAVRKLAGFSARFGHDHAAAPAFAELAAPYREDDLESRRAALHERELERLEARAERLKAQQEAEAEQIRRQAEADAAQRQREEEARRQAEREAKERQEALQRQEQLRWQTIEHCRRHEYDEATLLLVPVLVSRHSDLKAWARQKQASIELAEEVFDSIINTSAQLAGTKLPVPGERKEWSVTDIGFVNVELELRRIVYDKGERREVVRTLEIPFAELSPIQLDRLTERKWALDQKSESSRQLAFGAYLLSRGSYLAEARKRLQASAEPLSRVFLEELEEVVPLVHEKEALRLMDQLRQLIADGNIRRAQALVAYFRRALPNEVTKHEDTIRELLSEP